MFSSSNLSIVSLAKNLKQIKPVACNDETFKLTNVPLDIVMQIVELGKKSIGIGHFVARDKINGVIVYDLEIDDVKRFESFLREPDNAAKQQLAEKLKTIPVVNQSKMKLFLSGIVANAIGKLSKTIDTGLGVIHKTESPQSTSMDSYYTYINDPAAYQAFLQKYAPDQLPLDIKLDTKVDNEIQILNPASLAKYLRQINPVESYESRQLLNVPRVIAKQMMKLFKESTGIGRIHSTHADRRSGMYRVQINDLEKYVNFINSPKDTPGMQALVDNLKSIPIDEPKKKLPCLPEEVVSELRNLGKTLQTGLGNFNKIKNPNSTFTGVYDYYTYIDDPEAYQAFLEKFDPQQPYVPMKFEVQPAAEASRKRKREETEEIFQPSKKQATNDPQACEFHPVTASEFDENTFTLPMVEGEIQDLDFGHEIFDISYYGFRTFFGCNDGHREEWEGKDNSFSPPFP